MGFYEHQHERNQSHADARLPHRHRDQVEAVLGTVDPIAVLDWVATDARPPKFDLTPDFSKVAELRGWWETTSAADFERMAPKIGEYTASDLTLMGRFLAEWTGMPEDSGPEAACSFYILGKVARAVAAYKDGRLPSEDTLHDIVIYAMMMRRIRMTGGWP